MRLKFCLFLLLVAGTEAPLHTDNLTSVQVSFDPVVNLTQVKLDLWFSN